jgi:hypothetical protein
VAFAGPKTSSVMRAQLVYVSPSATVDLEKSSVSVLGGRPLGTGICAKLQTLIFVSVRSYNQLNLMMFSDICVSAPSCFTHLVEAWKCAFAEIFPNVGFPMRCDSK